MNAALARHVTARLARRCPYRFAPPRPAAGAAGPFTFALSADHFAINAV